MGGGISLGTVRQKETFCLWGDPLKTELSFGRRVSCSTGFPPLGECSRNPSVSVHQLALVWEADFGFSEFFWNTLSTCLLISWLMIYEHTCPHSVLSDQQFLTKKWHDPRAHPPNSPNLSLSDFFFVSPDGKTPQRDTFCQYGRGETKNSRSTKRHKNRGVQKLFWAVKRSLIRCIALNGEYFVGDWSFSM